MVRSHYVNIASANIPQVETLLNVNRDTRTKHELALANLGGRVLVQLPVKLKVEKGNGFICVPRSLKVRDES